VRELVAIALAGALGSLGRHGASVLTVRWFGDVLPYGTLAVNTLGSLILGTLTGLALVSDVVPASIRVPVATGFLGAFTTFSTFSVETVRLAERDPWLAAANVAANLVLGLGAAVLGVAIGRWLGA
jgi:CrcB protein